MYTYDITVSLLYLYYIYLFKFTLFYCPYTLPFPSQNRKLETIVYKSNSASAWLYTTVDSADRSRFPRCEIHGSRRIVIYENRTTRIVSSKPVMETNIKIKMKKEKKGEKNGRRVSWNSWKFASPISPRTVSFDNYHGGNGKRNGMKNGNSQNVDSVCLYSFL